MQNSFFSETRRGLLLTLFVLGLVTALILVPYQFRSEAGAKGGEGLFTRTVSHDDELPNYDIRTAKEDALDEYFASARQSVGKDASFVADTKESFVRGENELRTRIPHVKFEYTDRLDMPEVITPDVWKSNIEFLSAASDMKRSEILRSFVRENNELIGVNDEQANALKVTADYTNPNGYMSFAHLEQRINDIPVFAGEVKAGFTKDGRIIRVINNLAPGLDYDSLSTDFRNPVDAVKTAYRNINEEPKIDVTVNGAASTDLKTVFGTGDFATTAEKMYFPTEPGVAVPSWRVHIWTPVTGYMVIVDAQTGRMLWRKNAGEDQTQSASYQVYNNPNAYMPAADSPSVLSPGPIDPTAGTQGVLGTRTTVTLIGNEAPNGFNNVGWITDGANSTDGNAVEAGIDRVAPDGVDAPQPGDSACPGAGCRVFSSTWNPPPGNPSPGDEPLTPQAQRGAVIQMFYVMNRYHDILYQLGFTEQAFNFQNDNFGRGGTAGDRVRAEGQDSSGTNNANFQTFADGTRGRMQMFLWNGPTPDYDGTADAEVIIHEVTHGTSNRLHGNASGLSTNMARGMGEGWSDFYSYTLLAEPSDPINGIYTTGGYATFLIAAGFTGNYYYGIRRFPRAPITFLGTNGKPHNPYTFRYVNSDCNTLIGTTTSNPPPNSAFPRGPIGVTDCDQVHNLGEVWSSALWEVRNRMVTRLGFTAGTTRALQVVTDGMKLAPTAPTFLSERDAIIAAAAALPAVPEASADVLDVREGFRVRGMGFSASIQTPIPAAVTEAFDFPNVVMTNPFSVSDSPGDNDGFPEPGENLLLSIAVTNTTGATVNNVVVSVGGGGMVNYGNIADGATVAMNVPYSVPGGAVCGSLHQVTINVSSDVGPQSPQMREFRLGVPVGGPPASFSNSTPIDMPNGQPTTTSGPFNPYPSNISVSGLSGPKIIKLTFNNYHHEFEDDLDFLLVGPGGQKYIFMSDVGGVTEQITPITFSVSDTGATLLPDATGFVNGVTYRPSNVGANDPFEAPAPGVPYENAAPGGSATFASVFGSDGAAMNGTWSLYGDDDAASDPGRIDNGWTITFEANDYACSLSGTVRSRADFDGDGRTDLSVFRPSEGNWYLNQSTAGFGVINWGIATDTLVPGDYDGDNKTDTAVFRPNADPAQPDYYILNSNGFVVSGVSWGLAGDVPLVADYDNDGNTDVAVYRPSNNTFYILNSGGGTNIRAYGIADDIPVAGDFIGDSSADITIFRPSTNTYWIFNGSGDTVISFGAAGDFLVPADYDGDNKDDLAVFRPSTGQWIYRPSSGGAAVFVAWGTAGDIPVPGDYDGDGRDDHAIYRNGTWWVNRSTAGVLVQNFGLSTDKAIPRHYLP